MCADVLEHDFREILGKIDFSKPYDPFGKTFMKALSVGLMWKCVKCLEDDVEEELSGAETYWRLYGDTGDTQYREMASDELRHAGILIKKHLAKGGDKAKMDAYEKRRQEMMKEVSPVKTA